VSNYQLSPHALADLRAIIEGRAEYFGSESADELEQELLAAFSRIAVTPDSDTAEAT
jgi:plasmid stabilization system protein ParE